MKKLSFEIDSAFDRKEKVALIDSYVGKNGFSSDLLPLMAKAKYLPDDAIKTLILDTSDDRASDAIRELKDNDFIPNRDLLFELIKRTHRKAAATIIECYKLVLTKSELMSIANKGEAEIIVVALSLCGELDREIIESLLRTSVSDDLERIYKLIGALNRFEDTSSKSVETSRIALARRAEFVLENSLNKALKEEDIGTVKELLDNLDIFNSKNEDIVIYVNVRNDKSFTGYSRKDYIESSVLLEIIKEENPIEGHFSFAIRTLDQSYIDLTETILKNLIRFDLTTYIPNFSFSTISINLLEKISKTDIKSYQMSEIVNKSSLKNKDKITFALKHNLLNELYSTVSSATCRTRNRDDYRNNFLVEIIIASGGLFSVLVKREKISSKMAMLIYQTMGETDRKSRLEEILSLESAITKNIRAKLSDRDKTLLADSSVKTSTASKKRTWFPEALNAITTGDLEEFRTLITSDYNLEMFSYDSKGKTNTERMSRSRKELTQNTWLNLTNEEFKSLKEMGFYFDNDLSRGVEIKCTRKWSETDLKILSKELKVICIAHTQESEALFIYLSKNKGSINNGGYGLNSFEDIVNFAYKFSYDPKGKSKKELDSKLNYVFDVIQPEVSRLNLDTVRAILLVRSKEESLKILSSNMDNYDLGNRLSFICKNGPIFTFADVFPLDELIISMVDKSYSTLRVLYELKEFKLPKIANAIGTAYISKKYKEDMAKLGLKIPTRRSDIQEIIEFLGVIASPEKEKSLTLRGMKSVIREAKSEVIEQIIETFKSEEVKTAIVKAWGVTDNTFSVLYSELNPKRLVNLDKLLIYCNLSCLIVGISPTNNNLTQDIIPFVENMVGLKNIKFKIIPYFFKNSVAPDTAMAETFILGRYELSELVLTHKKVFMSQLENFNLTGEGFDILNSMDPNEIIEKMSDIVAIYILGEKRMLTRKTFIQVQDKCIDFVSDSDLLLMSEYVGQKIGCNSKDVPFLYKDDKIDGINNLNEEESVVLIAKMFIDEFVKGDRAINIKALGPKRKLELIAYSMKSWKIVVQSDISQLNLEDLDSLDYWTLESFMNLETKSLSKIFGFREDDKKIVQKVRDLLATNGIDEVRKVMMMRELWTIVIGDSTKLTLDDTLGSENEGAFCSKHAKEISQFLNSLNANVIASKFILSNPISAGKLRDWINTGEGYFEDTFEAIEKITITNNSIKATTAKAIGVTDENYDNLKNGSDNAMNSLGAAIKNSDFSVIHDIAMKLVSVGSEEMLEVENQDQYERLETPEFSKKLGCTLFFPKLYSDTYALGTQNGWCVSSTQTYSSKVREGEAILVGIAPEGEYSNREQIIESCEALLYVLFDRKGDVSSYQIMYSNMMNSDLSKKMPIGTSRKQTIGQQRAPNDDRYPVNKIIDMVMKIRNREVRETKAA
jgi:hypothetical protein